MKSEPIIEEPGTWNIREVPREQIVKAKIGAAMTGLSVKHYLMKLVDDHWREMERNGTLPKSK